MKYLLVLLTSTLSAAKVTFQGFAAKKEGKTLQNSMFFCMLMFLSAALLFSPYLRQASPIVMRFAAVYALCNVSFQVIYISALSRGNVSVAVMFANFGMVVPTAVSFVLFKDIPSPTRTFGILLTGAAFALTLKQGAETKRGYRLFVLLAFIANGCSLSVQKLFGKACANESILSFVSMSYMISAVLCAAGLALIMLCSPKSNPISLKTVIPAAIGAGVSLGLYLAVNTYAGRMSDGSFHYPAHSVTTMLLSALTGILIFREKASKQQIIAYILGIIAIILMNF